MAPRRPGVGVWIITVPIPGFSIPIFSIPCSQVDPDFRLHIYLRISALLLEDEDSVQAEIYVTRASELAIQTKNMELSLKFKVRSRLVSQLALTVFRACGKEMLKQKGRERESLQNDQAHE